MKYRALCADCIDTLYTGNENIQIFMLGKTIVSLMRECTECHEVKQVAFLSEENDSGSNTRV